MIKYLCRLNQAFDFLTSKKRNITNEEELIPVIMSMYEIAAFQRNFGKDSLTILGAKEV